MKKFVFSLQSVYDYKKTIEKKQKDELRVAQSALLALQQELRHLENRFVLNTNALDELLEKNENILEELPKFDAFFQWVREERVRLEEEISKAEEVKNEIMARLIRTMRELKTYGNLKDEQFARYKEEVAREEEKEIGDIVSFKATFPEEI